jgi:phosphate transport system substrate-binding protein
MFGCGLATPVAARPHPSALRCMGASTMQHLVAAWMQAAQAGWPANHSKVLGGSRFSATGVQAALRGKVNCVTFAREPFPAEVRGYQHRFGAAPILIPVAQGSERTPHGTFALAVFVNRSNPLRRLTMRQLRRVLGADPVSGSAVRTWGELGGSGAWRQRPVHVYGMQPMRATGNPPGIVNFLQIRVLRGWPWRKDLRVRTDTPRASALTRIVRAVGSDPDGIGYSGIGYADPSVAKLAIAKHADGPYFLPAPGNVKTARYPLARLIYLGFTPDIDGQAKRAACRLVSLALGPTGRRLDASDAMRFLPLTATQTRVSRGLAHRTLGCALHVPPAGPAVRRPPGTTNLDASTLTIIGYNDMAGMVRLWNRAFARHHAGVRFIVRLQGTRTAPGALADGTSQLAPMGAPFSARERRAYLAQQPSGPVGLRVAHASNDPRARSSPIALYVHPGNPLRQVTLDQLRRVFTRASASKGRTWSMLGLDGHWATRTIDVCGLAPNTALGRYMIRRLLHGGRFAHGYLAFSESAGAVRQAATDRDALCFGDLNDTRTTARRLAIVAGPGRTVYTGTRAQIRSGDYPLDRFLYLYVRNDVAASPRGGLVCAYLDMVLSARGQALLATAPPGYIPLDRRELRHQRTRLRGLGCTRIHGMVSPTGR